MMRPPRNDIPPNHPLRSLFLNLTVRGMDQLRHRDREAALYLSTLLTEFAYTDNLYRISSASGARLQYLSDMVLEASAQMPPEPRRAHYRHIGDLALFNLGLFPESLTYGRRLVSADYLAGHGRRSYHIAAESEYDRETAVLRRLSEEFETYVASLHWVKAYIQDPFFQYMLREFDVT